MNYQISPDERYHDTGCWKYIFYFLLWCAGITILLLLAIKCEETHIIKNCWECTIKTTYEYPGESPYAVDQIGHFEYCDVTQDFIIRFEMSNTWTDKEQNITQVANCKLKGK